MLSFFRRLIHSRFGVPVTLGILIMLGVAFGLTDITGLSGNGVLGNGTDVAVVEGHHITADQVRDRMNLALENARQQNPKITIKDIIAQGGLEQIIDQMVDGAALDAFAAKSGMVVNKRVVDGEIASTPIFAGLDGKFDQKVYDNVLAERKMTDAMVRDLIKSQMVTSWMIAPISSNATTPSQVALPYASLLLEKRSGAIASIPSGAFPVGPAPSDAQLSAYYTNNKLRYVVPERRVFRYAIVTPDQVKDAAVPTEAEIAQAYKTDHDKYAPSEKRTVQQVIVADQATATAMAAKIRAGTPIAKAATDAGLEAATLADQTRDTLAGKSSAAIAQAIFAAPKGAPVGPIKSGLGWLLAVTQSITNSSGKTLDQARPELVAEVTKRKTTEQLAHRAQTIEDSITSNATFDEITRDNKLTPVASAPLLASGVNPDTPDAKPDPAMAPLLKAAFAATVGDDPAVVPLGADGGFAVIKLDRVVAAAPKPLAQIHDFVLRDYQLDGQFNQARAAAAKVVAAIARGTPLAQAISALGIKTPPISPVSFTREQVQMAGDRVPEPVRLLFALHQKEARLVPGGNRLGYAIVYCDQITPGTAAPGTPTVTAAQQQLSQMGGDELRAQFMTAVRKDLKISRNETAIGKLRQELSGEGAQ